MLNLQLNLNERRNASADIIEGFTATCFLLSCHELQGQLSFPVGLSLLQLTPFWLSFSHSQSEVSKLPNTNLKSALAGRRGCSITGSSDGDVLGFTSVQYPTAIVKVEAGIGMVT